MTPTDELCAKLGELGIKYTADDSNDYEVIEWGGLYNLWWQFVYDPYEEEPYGELRLLETGSTHLTPEQAIDATVGVGTCHCTTSDDAWCFSCSSCCKSFPRSELHIAHNHGEINYCPNCGARIEKGKDNGMGQE